MKIWKLVSGILCIVLFAFVFFQSCAVGIAEGMAQSNEAGGGGGIILAVCMLTGGIVSICTRNSVHKGGNIALLILFGIAALTGSVTAGSFKDLKIWAGWCLICAVMAAADLFRKKA